MQKPGSARFDARIGKLMFSTAPKVRAYNAIKNRFLNNRVLDCQGLQDTLYMPEADALILLNRGAIPCELRGWLNLADNNEAACAQDLGPSGARYSFGVDWKDLCKHVVLASFMGADNGGELNFLNGHYYSGRAETLLGNIVISDLGRALETYFGELDIQEKDGVVCVNFLSPERAMHLNHMIFAELMMNLGMLVFIDRAFELGIQEQVSMTQAMFFSATYAAEALRVCILKPK